MTTLSGNIKNGQLLQFKAGGQAINSGDLVQIGGAGLKAYPVKTIDYAISGPASIPIAQASLGSSITTGDRAGVVTDQYGFIFVLYAGQLIKYNPASSTALYTNSSAVGGTGSGTLLMLSNGNIACIGVNTATGAITYGVCDSDCNSVKASTAVGTGFNASTSTYFGACALSGGGFAIAYLNAAGTQMSLQTYDNSGVAVLAATNIQTFGGTPTLVYTRLAQLSNGNLVTSFKSPTATPAGLSFVITTTAGVSVVANTVVDNTAAAGFHELATMTGFFTTAAPNGTNVKGAVYSNAGALQGGAYTLTDASNPTTYLSTKLVSDGVQFWCVYCDTSSTFVAKIPTSGTGFVNTNVAASGNRSIDAALQGAVMLILQRATDTSGSQLLHVQLPDAELNVTVPTQVSNTTVGTTAATTGTFWPKLIFNGDFTGIAVYDKQNPASTNIVALKVAATAIQGISQTTNAVNSQGTYGAANLITVNSGPGAYPINNVSGTSGMNFSHGSLSPAGNIGKVFNNGVSLAGASVPRNIN